MHRVRDGLPSTAVLLALCAGAAPAVAAPGDIFTVAGSGGTLLTAERLIARGDGGPATEAILRLPLDVAPLGGGGYLIADAANRRVRRVSRLGRITTVAGTGRKGSAGDGGPPRRATFTAPTAVAVTPDGGFLVADFGASRIRRVSPAGKITTVAGTGRRGFSGDGGPATRARVAAPGRIVATPDGGFVFADSGNHRVRRVTPGGVISTVAGTGRPGFSGDGRRATRARLRFPIGVDVTAGGALLIADTDNHRIRRVSPGGIISSVAGSGRRPGFGGDGRLARGALLAEPEDVEALPGGAFVFTDVLNARVRVVSRRGRIGTVAGSGTPRFTGDGRRAIRAGLLPSGVAVVPDGLLVTDPIANRVRFVQLVRTRRLAIALIARRRSGPRFSLELRATTRASLRVEVLRGTRRVATARGAVGKPFRFRSLRRGRYTIRVVARTRSGQVATSTQGVRLTAAGAAAAYPAGTPSSSLVISTSSP